MSLTFTYRALESILLHRINRPLLRILGVTTRNSVDRSSESELRKTPRVACPVFARYKSRERLRTDSVAMVPTR